MAKRKRRSSGVQAIGGALVGFDHQIMRSVPPPHEAVRKGDRLPAVPADDGSRLVIGFPDDPPRSAAGVAGASTDSADSADQSDWLDADAPEAPAAPGEPA